LDRRLSRCINVVVVEYETIDDYRQIPHRQPRCVDGSDEIKADVTVLASSHNLQVESKNKIDQKSSSKENPKVTTAGSQEDEEEERKQETDGDNNNKDTRSNSDEKEISKGVGVGISDFSDAFILIKRSKSAKKPTKVVADSVENFKPLSNGDCGDGITNPYDNKEVADKFWSQRRRLFTLFDNGIQLDKESWYSVTPEAIANHISAHLVSNRENAIILDPFCGCGGNAIAFARMEEVKLVVCIDKDLEKLKMAASNATIYNISTEKMVFIHDNAANILSLYDNKILAKKSEGNLIKNKEASGIFKIGGTELLPEAIDCIFLSPPWGGLDYEKIGKRNYTLQCINVDGIEENTQMDGEDILNRAAKALGQDGPIALFLPRNINGVALGRSVLRAGYDCPMVLEKNVLNGKLKTVTAYIGL